MRWNKAIDIERNTEVQSGALLLQLWCQNNCEVGGLNIEANEEFRSSSSSANIREEIFMPGQCVGFAQETIFDVLLYVDVKPVSPIGLLWHEPKNLSLSYSWLPCDIDAARV